MSFLEIFEYTQQKSIIHELDPRSKLVLSIVLAVCSLLFLEIIPLLIFLSFVLMPFIIAAKSVKRWLKSMRGLSFLLLFIIIFNTLFSTAPHPFSTSIALCIRLIALMTSLSVFFLTVHPDHLAQALIQMHVKFEFAFAMSMAMRYVPTLAQEAYAIMDAQKARGVELDKGSPIRRIRNIIPIIVPLLVVSIRRALAVAESMESRGFGSSSNRTYMDPLRFSTRDWLVVAISVVTLIVIVYVRLSPLPSWLLWHLPV